MIISASRRTDIPAFFSDWFFGCINEGSVQVRNPVNHSQIRTVSLNPNDVDCIAFWTKNPKAMISRLDKLDNYHYYFQFTLNPYDADIEPGLPDKNEIIDTFRQLSDIIGVHRVIWRYDPVLLNDKYSIQYHVEHFGRMASALSGYTEKVVISFIDIYAKIKTGMERLGIKEMSPEQKSETAKQFAAIAHAHNLPVETCAEDIDLCAYGITHGRCIDGSLIERITGKALNAKKDRSQRQDCGCAAAADIGTYNSCLHGCLYCYAGGR